MTVTIQIAALALKYEIMTINDNASAMACVYFNIHNGSGSGVHRVINTCHLDTHLAILPDISAKHFPALVLQAFW